LKVPADPDLIGYSASSLRQFFQVSLKFGSLFFQLDERLLLRCHGLQSLQPVSSAAVFQASAVKGQNGIHASKHFIEQNPSGSPFPKSRL
jgi:hypothetical protein